MRIIMHKKIIVNRRSRFYSNHQFRYRSSIYFFHTFTIASHTKFFFTFFVTLIFILITLIIQTIARLFSDVTWKTFTPPEASLVCNPFNFSQLSAYGWFPCVSRISYQSITLIKAAAFKWANTIGIVIIFITSAPSSSSSFSSIIEKIGGFSIFPITSGFLA